MSCRREHLAIYFCSTVSFKNFRHEADCYCSPRTRIEQFCYIFPSNLERGFTGVLKSTDTRSTAAPMLRMDRANVTMASQDDGSLEDPTQLESNGENNEYFYILIVMCFYGIFLMGIMLVYMRSKKREKETNLLFLYRDEEGQWMENRKSTPILSIPKSFQNTSIFNVLQESVGPALSCSSCQIEGSSLSSESSCSDVPFTIQEEATESLLQEGHDPEENAENSQIS